VDCKLVSKWYSSRISGLVSRLHLSLDASPGLKRALSEEYSNSLNFSDGEIYCKIHQNKAPGNSFMEKKWWAHLSKSKRKDLKQFLKHDSFPKAFDALLVIPALFTGLRISMFRELIAIKCNKVCLSMNYSKNHILMSY
jgi:hypothetical protein